MSNAIKLLLSLSTLLVFETSLASLSCDAVFAKEVELYQNINEVTHNQVEFFNRNNNIGLQYRGDLTFKVWTELSFKEVDGQSMYSVVGLTQAGTLYHLVGVGQRKLARKLSGHEVIEGFRLTNKGRILAWNNKNQTLNYSEPVWLTPIGRRLARRFMATWGITAVGALTLVKVLQSYLWHQGMDISVPIETFMGIFKLPIFESMVVFASGLSAGFTQIHYYENLNMNPNGFTVTPVARTGRDWLDLELSPQNIVNLTTPRPEFLPPEIRAELTESYSE